ncbi:hypothetical protein [Sphingobacterium mizutaii]|nr:hypothetical protein [Sphingobacterium mizutaii]
MRGLAKIMEKNQDYVDGKICQDHGKEPGLNGCEDRPRSRE